MAEGYILSEEEKIEIMKVAVEEVNGRVPVYASTGLVGTKDTIRLSQKAKEVGVDVLSIITPSFAAASQEELYTHFKTVAENVDMPIVLYNIPARTGNAIAPATVGKLSTIDNIIGVKDSSQTGFRQYRICGSSLRIFYRSIELLLRYLYSALAFHQ